MAIDSISVSLGTLPSPFTKENRKAITVTANTKLAGVDTDATFVEFILEYVPLTSGVGSAGTKMVQKLVREETSDSTGNYSTVFPASDFVEPGLYQVKARGIVQSGSPIVVTSHAVASSAEFQVVDENYADEFNILDDEDLSWLEDSGWFKVTLTGADIKRLLVENGVALSAQSGTIILDSGVTTDTLLTGGFVKVNDVLSGPTTLTASIGADSSTYNEVQADTSLLSAAETGVSASFVPNLAGGTTVRSLIKATTMSETLADIDDGGSVTFAWGYTTPTEITL